jgi:hypothetical protein
MRIEFARGGTILALGALLALPACDRDSTGPNDHDVDMHALEVIDRGETAQPVVATWTLAGGWDGGSEIPTIDLTSANQRISIGFRAYDQNGEEITLEEDGEYSIRYRVENPAQTALDMDHDDDTLFHGDHVHIYGAEPGSAEVRFIFWHVDHSDRETTPIGVPVTD